MMIQQMMLSLDSTKTFRMEERKFSKLDIIGSLCSHKYGAQATALPDSKEKMKATFALSMGNWCAKSSKCIVHWFRNPQQGLGSQSWQGYMVRCNPELQLLKVNTTLAEVVKVAALSEAKVVYARAFRWDAAVGELILVISLMGFRQGNLSRVHGLRKLTGGLLGIKCSFRFDKVRGRV